ncbi:MAG: hypothetical protein KDJ41_02180 [Hyphomicrobiaceae bacterium]|nr:hypothetical protein [Hyphomicrobiaceae bacterium]
MTSKPEADRPLSPDEVERLLRHFHTLEVDADARALSAGDTDRVSAAVKALADAKKDFFDVPGSYGQVLAEGKAHGEKR